MSEIVYVEFTNDMRPFSIITTEENSGSHFYDVEYSKRDEMLYYHISGIGGFDGSTSNDMPYFWAADGVNVATFGDGSTAGKQLYALPAPYTTDPDQFFAEMEESEVIYCKVCDDWLPDESRAPCQHLRWCSECEEFSGSGAEDPCPHIRYCTTCDDCYLVEQACRHTEIG